MKKWIHPVILSLLIILNLTACSSNNQTKNSTGQKLISAHVTRVVDGDTLKVMLDNKKEDTVRLLLIDTPETVHPNKPIEPYGPEASDFTKQYLMNQEVTLELDISERDQYGRLLAYVWMDDTLFNELLLEQGLARVVVYPPNVKYVDEFRSTQKKAQHESIGLWSLENYSN